MGSAFAVLLALTSESGAFGVTSVLAFWLTVTIGTAGARAAGRRLLRASARLATNAQYVIIAGTGPRAMQLYRQIVVQTSHDVLGFVDTAAVAPLGPSGPPFLGTIDEERFGFNRRRLRMYKFRTMVTDAEARQAELEALNQAKGPVFKIRDDPRVTRVGRFLRKTSIDELRNC